MAKEKTTNISRQEFQQLSENLDKKLDVINSKVEQNLLQIEELSIFSKLRKMKKHHQLIYALVIAAAVALYWRGLWLLYSAYVFPGNTVLSGWTSFITGLLILIGARYVVKLV